MWMKKSKTYVITVSRNFPKGSFNEGKQTNFIPGIIEKLKIHTIRKNFKLWEKRFEEVAKGNAIISLRYWSEKPYQSKQVEFLKLDKNDGIGIEKLELIMNGFLINDVEIKIDLETLAKNDGLTRQEFKDWFKDVQPNSDPMVIIHFTKYRYINEITVK